MVSWVWIPVLYAAAAATVGMLAAFVPVARRRPSVVVVIGVLWPLAGLVACALILGSAWHPGPQDDLPP